MDRRMEKRAPMSQSQEVREIFHTRFDGCLVLNLIRILTLTKMSNFDITELLRDGQTNRQTNGKVGTCVAKSGGQGDVSCKV